MTRAPVITQNADVRFLGKLLGDVIRTYGGDALLDRIEAIRAASVDRYRGIANPRGLPAGWESGRRYNPPRRNFFVTLSGELEIEASDGEVRRLGPGTVLLAEDLSGKGHITRSRGGEWVGMLVTPSSTDTL